MNFEPQKFFIVLMDFFYVLLTGALLTWLLMDDVGPVVLGDRYAALDGAQAWRTFLFASYLSGHLVFLLGSRLDGIHDWPRDRTLNRQIRHVASTGRVMHRPLRSCVWLVFKRERNLAEAGVWARIVHDLGTATWSVKGSATATRFFLMRAMGRGQRQDRRQRHEWRPLQEAVAKASLMDTR